MKGGGGTWAGQVDGAVRSSSHSTTSWLVTNTVFNLSADLTSEASEIALTMELGRICSYQIFCCVDVIKSVKTSE